MTDELMIPLRLCPPERLQPEVVSVMVPSRKRPEKLRASIRSLRLRASRPEQVNILVAHDPDDQDTARVARSLSADVVFEAPERYGYARCAYYWAALLELAEGEWLLPTWSDDAIMITDGWDDTLRAQPIGSIVFLDGNVLDLTCYPAVHCSALAAIGRLAPLPALDTWFEYVGRDAGVLTRPGIYVHQDRPDLTGCAPDQTYIEGGGAWRAGTGGTTNQAFYHEPYITWRAEDATALRKMAVAIDG